MKILKALLAALLAVSATGCLTVNVPPPPDIYIHGELHEKPAAAQAPTSAPSQP